MTQNINLHSITQIQFIHIMQVIGINNDTYKYRRYKSIRTQQYKTISELPGDLSDQINLFKGLVLCERDFNWIGGSAASNIKVYREISSHPFMQRHQDKLDELINWTLQNRGRNPYTPFGSWRYEGCRSISDMKRWDEHRELQLQIQLRKEREISNKRAKKNSVKEKLNKLRPLRRYIQNQTHKLNIELFMLENFNDRFKLLLENKLNFPVNLLPESFWQEVLTRRLNISEIKTLLNILPRKTSRYIKRTLIPELRKKKQLSMVSSNS